MTPPSEVAMTVLGRIRIPLGPPGPFIPPGLFLLFTAMPWNMSFATAAEGDMKKAGIANKRMDAMVVFVLFMVFAPVVCYSWAENVSYFIMQGPGNPDESHFIFTLT